jgi:lipopolysaccharide transport system ATP-binding protein
MTSEEYVIKIRDLSKCYRIGLAQNKHETLAQTFWSILKQPVINYKKYRSLHKFDDVDLNKNGNEDSPDDLFWALKGVSFNIKPGEVVGIIGKNGAGKSTLLKILSRITDPSAGSAEIKGRVTSLLEVGTGFHEELTGRENIYLNGTILGMTKTEIDKKFDQIVEFSGIDKFIDTPVKRYSSGMTVRLAFSVSAHLDAEILIIDEVLAVGDASFQEKCLGKMEAISNSGRTILFVSHNIPAVKSLCSRTVVLENGQVISDSTVENGIREYFNSLERQSKEISIGEREDRKGGDLFRFTDIEILDPVTMATVRTIQSGQSITIKLSYQCKSEKPIEKIGTSIAFSLMPGCVIVNCRSELIGKMFTVPPGEGILFCHIPKIPLKGGRYSFDLAADKGGFSLDWIKNAGFIEVEDGDYYELGRPIPPDNAGVLIDFDWVNDAP